MHIIYSEKERQSERELGGRGGTPAPPDGEGRAGHGGKGGASEQIDMAELAVGGSKLQQQSSSSATAPPAKKS